VKNPVAKQLRTPKFRQKKVEDKKKYNRKKEVTVIITMVIIINQRCYIRRRNDRN